MAKNSTATVSVESQTGIIPATAIKPGTQATVGGFTIANRGLLPVQVSEGAKGGLRYAVGGINVTGVLRWIGCNGYSWDAARAFLVLCGLGEAVKDNTVTAQTTSGKRVASGRESFHGPIPTPSAATEKAFRDMLASVATAAAEGKAARRSHAAIAEVKGKGKNAKPVAIPFDWRNPLAAEFTMQRFTESGKPVKAKRPTVKRKK